MIPEATSVLAPASPQGREVLDLFWIVLILAGVIFLVVTTLVITAVIRFRERPGGPPPSTLDESITLEVVWTVIPTLILAALFVLTVRVMHQVAPNPKDSRPDLRIVAHQWWWELHYPQYGVTSANEFHLPVQRQLLLRLESADVVHDFWVPALGQKVDAIPNHPNYAWYDVERPGIYLGTCAEFCGAEHAWMRIRVIAEPVPAFGAWLEEQLLDARKPTSPAAEAGARLFQNHTCMNCHSIRGTAADGDIGPDLTHLASRQTLAAGVFRNTHENLLKWVSDPQKYKPGSHMPNMDLSRQTFEELVAYLEELK